jgi:hypothetical protein
MVRVRHVAAIALVALLAVSCAHSGSSASGTSVFKINIGDCLVPPTAIKAEITSIQVVPCSTPHTQEVFATVNYSGVTNASNTSSTTNAYPGDPALRTFADGACLQKFAAYVGVDYRDSTLFYTYLMPSARSWGKNDRKVVCVITTTGQKFTASVKGSRR